jgi:hypothetical protein
MLYFHFIHPALESPHVAERAETAEHLAVEVYRIADALVALQPE